MIDQEALARAYATDGIYALQLEVGDRCFQDCVYCYMNALTQEQNSLSDDQIDSILRDACDLGVAAVEWLGGEPLLRSSIYEHMALAQDLGLRNNVWTGGLPLQHKRCREKCAVLARPGLVAVHVSTVAPELYARLHPHRGPDDLPTILNAVEELLHLGYPADQILNSATFTGLQPAADLVATIDYFAQRFGVKTCVNVYHTYLRPETPPGELVRFIPSADEVAQVYAHLARTWQVEELPMNCVNKQYCSATIAVLCDGSVTPCATIRTAAAANIHARRSLGRIIADHRDELIFKILKRDENLPADCRACRLTDRCWGCRSRAFAAGLGIDGKDPRCFRGAAAN